MVKYWMRFLTFGLNFASNHVIILMESVIAKGRAVIMKKYLQTILRYLIVYLLGFAAFIVIGALVSVFHNALCNWMPDVFVHYNFITEPEAAEAQRINLNFITGIITVFVLAVISVKYDNSRYEFVISKTDGFYTLREGASIYASHYLVADTLAAVLVPMTTVGLVFIKITKESPKLIRQLERYLDSFIALPLSYTEKLGFTIGVILLALTSLLSRVAAVYSGLKRWRGVWLSDIDRQD